MQHAILMRPGSGREPLVVKIPDDTPVDQRMRVAVETAVRQNISLQQADLHDADLHYADFRGADFRGVDFRDANLLGPKLRGGIFSPPDDPCWSPIRDDLARVLDQAQLEISGLLAALQEGRVDGRVYHGECACLVGTIANVRGVPADTLPFRNATSPIERLFMAISKGDTPETNPISRIVEAWIVAYRQHRLSSVLPHEGSQ